MPKYLKVVNVVAYATKMLLPISTLFNITSTNFNVVREIPGDTVVIPDRHLILSYYNF